MKKPEKIDITEALKDFHSRNQKHAADLLAAKLRLLELLDTAPSTPINTQIHMLLSFDPEIMGEMVAQMNQGK